MGGGTLGNRNVDQMRTTQTLKNHRFEQGEAASRRQGRLDSKEMERERGEPRERLHDLRGCSADLWRGGEAAATQWKGVLIRKRSS